MSKYYSSSIAFGAEQTKTEQVVVSPTKIGGVTTDAVSGALTVDEVPTLNSLNPVSSDGVARAVIQAGAELPTRGSSDTGKVLTVVNSDGDLEWDKPAEELPDMEGQSGKLLGAVDNNGTMEAQWVNPPDSYPSVAGNANKVLTVNSGATGVEWAAVPSELPTATSADNGKVLGVTDTSGTLDWVAQPTKGSLMVKAGTTQKELYDAWAAGWTIQSNRGNELNVYELTHFEHEYDEYTAIFSRVYFADALIYEDSFAIDGITDSTSAVTFGSKTTKTSNRVPDASSQTVGKVLTIKSVPDDDPIASWETPETITIGYKEI